MINSCAEEYNSASPIDYGSNIQTSFFTPVNSVPAFRLSTHFGSFPMSSFRRKDSERPLFPDQADIVRSQKMAHSGRRHTSRKPAFWPPPHRDRSHTAHATSNGYQHTK